MVREVLGVGRLLGKFQNVVVVSFVNSFRDPDGGEFQCSSL